MRDVPPFRLDPEAFGVKGGEMELLPPDSVHFLSQNSHCLHHCPIREGEVGIDPCGQLPHQARPQHPPRISISCTFSLSPLRRIQNAGSSQPVKKPTDHLSRFLFFELQTCQSDKGMLTSSDSVFSVVERADCFGSFS